jgi:hypothetical protein
MASKALSSITKGLASSGGLSSITKGLSSGGNGSSLSGISSGGGGLNIGNITSILPKPKRFGLTIASTILYVIGILTFFINAILNTIIITRLKGYSDYSENKKLQNAYGTCLGITITLWISFVLFLGVSLFLGPISNIPYISAITLSIFSIFNIATLITSILILINVKSSKDDPNSAVDNSLIGSIVLNSIVTITFIIYSIYGVITYKKLGGISSDIELAINIATLV